MVRQVKDFLNKELINAILHSNLGAIVAIGDTMGYKEVDVNCRQWVVTVTFLPIVAWREPRYWEEIL